MSFLYRALNSTAQRLEFKREEETINSMLDKRSEVNDRAG